MLKNLSIISAFLLTSLTFAWTSYAQDRVPEVFTGNSTAPAYVNYARYRNKKDSRDSRNYAGYYLNLARISQIRSTQVINRVHTHVRDIARDGLCSGTCFRVYIYLNGDLMSGEHVATFVVSPGTGRRTPLDNNAQLRRFTRSLTSFERPTQYRNFDMYRIYGSKSYPAATPNMPNAMFYRDAIAIHGSFDTVNGEKQSKGCVRMFPDESYFLHSLGIEAEGNVTFDVVHTR